MNKNKTKQPGINITQFGTLADGQEVLKYTLKNKNNLKLSVINYGGLITNLLVPDREGNYSDIVLGYNKLEDYLEGSPYFGALIGRFGNRIADGQFVLDGKEYELALNNEPGGLSCHLHGGDQGFDKVIWDVEPIFRDGMAGLKLHYLSNDGEEGYPGNLKVDVYYFLTNQDTLRIEYYAETDKATPINLTQHSYFNLKGEGEGDILDHQLSINAEGYTPVNEGLIPTGEIETVNNTPFDFRIAKNICQDINKGDQQLDYGGGYDHNYVLNSQEGELCQAALVFEPQSGRELEVWTTEPGVQFYSGNNLDGSNIGKSEKPYIKNGGFCLETQHYPDSPNQDNFPSTILRLGEKYETVTELRFSSRTK